MRTEEGSVVAPSASDCDLLAFEDIEREGNGYPKKGTLEVWKCTNRYGFRDIVIMVGARPRVRRPDWNGWLESRRLSGRTA